MTRIPPPQARVAVCAAGILVALAQAAPASAGPFETKTTGIADSLEINTSVEHERSADERTWEIPLEFVFPVTPWMEAGIEQKYAIAEDGTGTHTGFKDLEIASKMRLLNGGDNAWGLTLGMKPKIKLPTGTRRVAPHEWGLELPVFAGRKFDRTSVYVQAAYKRTFGINTDKYEFSTLVMQDITKAFDVGAELVSTVPGGHASDYTLEASAGLSWRVNPHLKLVGLAGRTVRTPNGVPVTKLELDFKFNL